jgi:hypothetical protein
MDAEPVINTADAEPSYQTLSMKYFPFVVLQLLQIARPSLTLRDLTPWKRLLHER